MGNNLFGANISGKLAAAMGSKMLPIVLRVPGAAAGVDANDPLAGTARADATDYECRGFEDNKSLRLFEKTRIVAGDIAINIFGDTIDGGALAPEPDHTIVYKGELYTVVDVKNDPDAALYTCQCRG